MACGPDTTADEVLTGCDLTDRHVVVTGASGGIGEETARALAAHGAVVTLAVRDLHKGEAAAERIRGAAPGARLELCTLELGSLASVRQSAAALLERHRHIDVLVNNAGVMACPFGRTEDGFEIQFGTNHLGHFLLTLLVRPALGHLRPSRIVNVSSRGHRTRDVDLDDPNFERTGYEPWLAYGRSKTANVLHAVGADRRWGAHGVHAYSLHPGVIATDLLRHQDEATREMLRTRSPSGKPMPHKSLAAGAATTVWAATAPELDAYGGAYLEDCGVAPVNDDDSNPVGVRSFAVDPERATALWVLSERLVGIPATA